MLFVKNISIPIPDGVETESDIRQERAVSRKTGQTYPIYWLRIVWHTKTVETLRWRGHPQTIERSERHCTDIKMSSYEDAVEWQGVFRDYVKTFIKPKKKRRKKCV